MWGGVGEREHTQKCLENRYTYVRSAQLMFRDIGLVRRDRACAEIGGFKDMRMTFDEIHGSFIRM